MIMSHRLLYLIWACFILTNLVGGVRDIDGTSSQVYVSYNQVFPKGSSLAQGYIRFNNGITVAQEASVGMDTFITVSGGLDVRRTGTLDLLADLFLAENFTFSTSGVMWGAIKGRGNTIFMGGALNLQQDKTFTFIGDTIIDGCGNRLIFGPHAQLLVDYGVTLTLRNMHCIVPRNPEAHPFIQASSFLSKVVFQNVIISSSEDYYFKQGNLFVHGDVIWTGTSAFVYQSGRPCVIDKLSELVISNNTTWFHNPASNQNNQLYMRDRTSTLVIDNATLQTTHTGMRIARGTLLLDNGVTFSTTASPFITAIAPAAAAITDGTVTRFKDVRWSDDGKYLALKASSGSNLSELRVVKFNADLTFSASGSVTSIPDLDGDKSNDLYFRADNKFIIIGNYDPVNTQQINMRAYSFDGTSVVALSSLNGTNLTYNITFQAIGVSPNFKYVFGGYCDSGNNGKYIVGSFNGYTLTNITSGDLIWETQSTAFAVSPDNKYIAILDIAKGSRDLRLFTFNGVTFSETSQGAYSAPGFNQSIGNGRGLIWSKDGRYLFACGIVGGNGGVKAYYFNGTAFEIVAVGNNVAETEAYALSVSPDGNYIVTAGVTSGSAGSLSLYRFDGGSLTLVTSYTESAMGKGLGVSWCSDRRYIVMTGTNSGTTQGVMRIYSPTYGFDTRQQLFNQGIILGNALNGAIDDVDVQILGATTVNVSGKVMYDNVS